MDGPPRVLALTTDLVDLLTTAFHESTVVVQMAGDIASARDALKNWRPHACILDLGDAAGRALDLLPELVANIPVMGLTREESSLARAEVLRQGLDEVVTIPLMQEEVAVRMLGLLRRSYGQRLPFAATIWRGELMIDGARQQTTLAGRDLQLTSRERSLLYLLATLSPRVVSRAEIVDSLWGSGESPDSNVIDQHIKRLRRKLGDDSRSPRFIQSVPGQGYRFMEHKDFSGSLGGASSDLRE